MNRKGFSIIELLISTAVIAIISAFTFAGYRYSGRLAELENEAHKIIGEIEGVRGMSYSGLQIEDDDGDRVEEFTVHFYEDEYVLMENTEKERVVSLGGGVYIPNDHKTVAFVPPEPETTFYDQNGNQVEDFVDIDLELRDTDDVKTIRINRIGLIQILE